MNIKQATRNLEQALDSYEVSRSDAARKRAKKALLNFLKAGGRVAVQQWAQEKSA